MGFPFRLLTANLLKHPIRTVLTFGSLVVALFLLCMLASLKTTLEAGVKNATADRLIVQSAMSLYVNLPEAYLAKVRAVEGVREASAWTWFGGLYQNEENFFAQFAVEPQSLLSMYPEIKVTEGSLDALLADRRGCLVGKGLVDRFGFKVGQTIPLIGTIYTRPDFSAWEFTVSGIYESSSPAVDAGQIFFRHDYLQEAIEQSAGLNPEGVSIFVARIDKQREPVGIQRDIDAQFAMGPQRTQTSTESEFNAQFVSMMGNIPLFVGSIGFAVFFSILLSVVNTMLMAAREQTRDVGILKALGFTGATIFVLFMGQSLLLAVLGGGAGVALGKLTEPGLNQMLAATFPGYRILPETVTAALIASVVVGLIAGIAPAWIVTRQKVVDALRTEA